MIAEFFIHLQDYVKKQIDKEHDRIPKTQINENDQATMIKIKDISLEFLKKNLGMRKCHCDYLGASIKHITNFSSDWSTVNNSLKLACVEVLDVLEKVLNTIVADMKAFVDKELVKIIDSHRLTDSV